MTNLERFPLPDYIQWYVERYAGTIPIWKFPNLPRLSKEVSFKKLNFENRIYLLKAFAEDQDIWVDKRFKDPKKLYEYIANLRIVMPYSGKHGGCDWLVFKDKKCVGVLHAFDFSREDFALHHRRCFIGYGFNHKVRGTGLPLAVVAHFIKFLFQQFDFLFLAAHVNHENLRSIRFLAKLGFEKVIYDPEEADAPNRFFECYASTAAKAEVMTERSYD